MKKEIKIIDLDSEVQNLNQIVNSVNNLKNPDDLDVLLSAFKFHDIKTMDDLNVILQKTVKNTFILILTIF